MSYTKRIARDVALCSLLGVAFAMPALATEPAGAQAQAASTYRLAIAGMT